MRFRIRHGFRDDRGGAAAAGRNDVWFEIPEIQASEAPVVHRRTFLNNASVGHAEVHHEYREFDGKLWCPVFPILTRQVSSKDFVADVSRNPLFALAGARSTRWSMGVPVEYAGDIEAFPDLARLRRAAPGLLLVDGKLYESGRGPIVNFDAGTSEFLQFGMSDGEPRVTPYTFRHDELDEMRAVFEEVGLPTEIPQYAMADIARIKTLGSFFPVYDGAAAAVESAAWTMVSALRLKPLERIPVDAVEAFVGLRASLSSRFPEGVEFDGPLGEIWPHIGKLRVTEAETAGLLPLMERLLPHVAQSVALPCRVALARAARKFGNDMDALAEVTFG